MTKAIFLDRDGVLNRETGKYICSEEELEMLPGVGEALSEWQAKGYRLFIVTNQAGISKGLYSHDALRRIHARLQDHLSGYGVRIQEIYYSPYHPDYCNSLSRKPGSLLLEKAMAKYGISAADSYMIGDRERDMEAAAGAGIKGILIESNQDLRTVLRHIS
jgi:D-glycero-D-manno-heptose 1,7-bisphosphate phosphatase